MNEKKKRLEVDLYKPIQKYFILEDYQVFGEVNDCDIAAVKDDEIVIIELKLTLSVEITYSGGKTATANRSGLYCHSKAKRTVRF